MQQGVSTGAQVGGAPDAGGADPNAPPGTGAPGGAGGSSVEQLLMSLPPEVKQKIMEMRQQGVPAEKIIKFAIQAAQGAQAQAQPAPQQQPATPPTAAPASNVAQQMPQGAARPY